MKNYKVFKHPDGRIEAVKQGWSWPGFFFGFIWALIKKLWAVAGILIGIAIVFGIISVVLEPNPNDYYNYYEYNSAAKSVEIWDMISNVLGIAVSIFLGVKGNSLRESNLLSKGYELIGTVNAQNPDMAVAEVKKSEHTSNNNNNNSNNNIISHM